MGPILTHLIHLKTTQDFTETEIVTCQSMTTLLIFELIYSLRIWLLVCSYFMVLLFSLIKFAPLRHFKSTPCDCKNNVVHSRNLIIHVHEMCRLGYINKVN